MRTATCVGVHQVILHFARDQSVLAIGISGERAFEVPSCVRDFARMDGFEDALARWAASSSNCMGRNRFTAS